MRRRQATSTPRTPGTGAADHSYPGGAGLRQSAAGPTGPTSHRVDVSRGVDWWVRPRGPAFAIGSSPARGRHHRVEQPRTGGLTDRLRARLGSTGASRTGDRLCAAAV